MTNMLVENCEIYLTRQFQVRGFFSAFMKSVYQRLPVFLFEVSCDIV